MSYLKKVVQKFNKPLASEVLTNYIEQCNFPPWTSYFVKQSSIINDQWGYSNFNWQVKHVNYQILRTGCYPYIKYHCSKKPHENLDLEDAFFGLIKIANLGTTKLLRYNYNNSKKLL